MVKYYDTAYREYGSEEYTADFSPCTEEWQFASVRFAKEKYRTIAYVRVYCDYGYNAGTVCFDDVQLVRSSIETGLSASDFVVESTGGADDAEAPAATSCILYIDYFAAPFRAAFRLCEDGAQDDMRHTVGQGKSIVSVDGYGDARKSVADGTAKIRALSEEGISGRIEGLIGNITMSRRMQR